MKKAEKNTKAGEPQKARKPKKRALKGALIPVILGVLVLLTIGMFSLYDLFFNANGDNKPTPSPTSAPTSAVTPTPTPEPDLSASAVITSIGDIILHQSVIDGGLQSDGTYQYDYIFKQVASYFEETDYTIANYEGALNQAPYSGYPMFNGPDAIASALRNAGVDMVTTANNHAFDQGLEGLKRTPTVFAQEGIKVIGTRSLPEDPKFHVVDLNGIKIGITGYTYETTGTEAEKALNGIILPKEAAVLVDSFNPYRAARYSEDLLEMSDRIQSMRDAGAECIIFVLHWGEEYKTVSNTTQQKLAQFLADQGVDVIFGHHPHVIQEISVIYSYLTAKETLVYYSLGNFLANMGFSTHSTNGYAEDAIIARVLIERDKAGAVRIKTGEYIGTYVYKDKTTGKTIHRIIPVVEALSDPAQYGMENQTALLTASAARINNVLAGSSGTKGSILIQEHTP